MLRLLAQVFLFVVLVAGTGAILRAIASAAFGSAGRTVRAAGGRTSKALHSPAPRAVKTAGRSAISAAAHPANSQIRAQARADTRRAWTEVKATDWIEQRRHERANGTGTGTSTTTAVKPTLSQRLRLRPFTPAHAASASGNGQNGGANGGGHVPAPVNGTSTPAPPPQATTPAQPASTNGGTVAAGTSTASADRLTEAINQIYAHAASGGLTAKQEAIAAMHEAEVKFAGMKQMLSRTMSEPGSNYGPEITEPLAKSGMQSQASAMLLSESGNALETLANMTLREVSQSPRQAPDKTELAESGRH